METLQRTANRGSISTGYDIDNSVKLEPDNSEFFQRAASGSSGNLKTWTFSLWLKRTELSHACIFYSQGSYGRVRFETDDTLTFYFNSGHELSTTRRFRDTSAWYHIVLAVDTTDGTAANRLKVYVNGVQETMSGTQPSQNEEGDFGKFASVTAQLGQFVEGSYYFAGYMAEFYWIDGIQQAPTEFGEFDDNSGIWRPIEYTGSFGNEGSFLNFSSPSDMGNDHSGNNNDYAVQNVNQNDQSTDSPTNVFCTFNPLMTQNNPPTISEGAMKSTGGGGTWNQTWGNMGVKNGKWYYEFKVTNASSTGYFGASTTPAEGSNTTGASLMYNTSFMVGGAARIDYSYWQNGSQVANESTGWGTISTNDVIGIALDLDSATKTFTVYKNGTALSGTLSQPVDLPTNMQDEFIFPLYVQYENRQDEANFGGYTISSISSPASDSNNFGTFEYAPPTGYYALCTKNLAEFG